MNMMGKKRGLVVMFFVLVIFILPVHAARQPIGEGGDYSIIITNNALTSQEFNTSTFSGYRTRMTLGSPFIGIGFDASEDNRVVLGWERLLNTVPVINGTAINANKTDVKHPFTNDTITCEVNITDPDVGDKIVYTIKWYKNSSSWYPNNETVNYSTIQDLITEYNVGFEEWNSDNETWNHTLIASVFHSTNVTPFRKFMTYDVRNGTSGSLEPGDTKHYDIWMCSVDAFDIISHSGYTNSSPILIHNNPPDYNSLTPSYYSWNEDTSTTLDLGSNFSDIDGDDVGWYINWTSVSSSGRFGIADITVGINNDTGIITLTPDSNIAGMIDIVFTAVENNASHTTDWALSNDYGRTETHEFALKVLQVNDNPWPSDVYVYSPTLGFQDTLTCMYTYNDLESHTENTTAKSYKWWLQDGGVGGWSNLNSNTSALSSDNFDLDDQVICSVKVKDTYNFWEGYSWMKLNGYGRLIGNTRDTEERVYETPDSAIDTSGWHHIVNTVDLGNNIRKIYVDGVLKTSSSFAAGNLGDTINWRLGQKNGSIEGAIDEVAIWSKELSSSEVTQLYLGNPKLEKYYDSDANSLYTDTEAIIIDLDGDGVYTAAADSILIDNADSSSAGDTIYDVIFVDHVYSNDSDIADSGCVYTASDENMTDGVVDTYYLGSGCAVFNSDIRIISSHNWATTDDTIDSTTDFIKENVSEELTFSGAIDTTITSASGGSSSPSAGDALTLFSSTEKYYDFNGGGSYTNAEAIITDDNCDYQYNVASDTIVKAGDNAPGEGTAVRSFASGSTYYPFTGSLDTSLEAYYKFEGNFVDAKGSNDGTNYGTVSSPGRACLARNFSKDLYIDLDLQKGNTYSISMWVNLDSLPPIPWVYTSDNLPSTPWFYSGAEVEQGVWSSYVNSSAITVTIESQTPTEGGQIVIGVG